MTIEPVTRGSNTYTYCIPMCIIIIIYIYIYIQWSLVIVGRFFKETAHLRE